MLLDEELLPKDFHMPGIEPWITAILKQYQLGLVLDIGTGIGFWGFLIKSYLIRNKLNDLTIIGVDLNKDKLNQLKKMRIYDEHICADAKHLPFRTKIFNIILAVESLYIDNFWDILRNIEALVKNRGLIVFSRGLSKNDKSRLLKQGYEIYQVYLRGLMLSRLRDGKSFYFYKEIRYVSWLLKLLYKVLKLKAKDYVIAIKHTG